MVEAVDNQPWSGEANVHVSIANWVKTQDASLLPKSRRLWFKIEQASKGRKARGSGQAAKDYELGIREVAHINASLSDKVDVGSAEKLACNSRVVTCQGVTPGHSGFLLDDAAVAAIPANEQAIIHPYLVGDDLLSGRQLSRSIIELEGMDLLQAKRFKTAFAHIEAHVLPEIQAKSDSSERSASIIYWWRHWRGRKELITAIKKLPRYLACSRVTKRPIFTFVDSKIRPGDALQVFALADDYSFGILQSAAHYQWFHAKCSNMKSDPRYTSESVFDTFPWPQNIASPLVDAVAEAGRKLRQVREQALLQFEGGLRALYRTLDLPGKNPLRDAHLALDAAVLKAYGFTTKQDLLEELLKLNQAVISQIAAGINVNGPGIPTGHPSPDMLLTDDAFGRVV